MTKITDISGSKPIRPPNTNTGIKAEKSDLFQKTLDNALQVKEGSTINTPKNILGEIQATAPLMLDTSFRRLDEKVSNLLDRLDVFASELNNPKQSLKNMEPVVQAMKNEADQISETIKKEGVVDENLKKISMESVMMANIEYHKFYRGDYI